MRVAVTGASGLIGSGLVPALQAAGHDVLTLVRRTPAGPAEVHWDPEQETVDERALVGVDAFVHLAGANIGTRWTGGTKERVLESRVRGTRTIAKTVARLTPAPALVCASGVGLYGDRGDEILTEASSRGSGFLAEVVEAWEAAADPARAAGARVVHLRQGIVVSRHGGAVQKLLLPFRLGLGGRVGNGRQWWSWVGLEDVVRGYLVALDGQLDGRFNLTSPSPVTNREFVRALGHVLHRPTVLPLPAFAVKLGFGQMGDEMLLGGQRAVPARLLENGFTFEHPELEAALEAALEA